MYGETEESIYNLVQEDRPKQERAPRYHSRFPGTLAPTASTFNVAQTSLPGVSNLGGHSANVDYGHKFTKVPRNYLNLVKQISR